MDNNPIRRQDKKHSLKPSAEIILLCIRQSVLFFLSGNYQCITMSTTPVETPLRTANNWPDRQDKNCSMVHTTACWQQASHFTPHPHPQLGTWPEMLSATWALCYVVSQGPCQTAQRPHVLFYSSLITILCDRQRASLVRRVQHPTHTHLTS